MCLGNARRAAAHSSAKLRFDIAKLTRWPTVRGVLHGISPRGARAANLFHSFIGDYMKRNSREREAKIVQTSPDRCDIVVGNIRIKDIPARLARRVIERLT